MSCIRGLLRSNSQLTPEEDFGKKSKRRVKLQLKYWLLKKEKFPIIIIISAKND